jgi:hypothetical protein
MDADLASQRGYLRVHSGAKCGLDHPSWLTFEAATYGEVMDGAMTVGAERGEVR